VYPGSLTFAIFLQRSFSHYTGATFYDALEVSEEAYSLMEYFWHFKIFALSHED
jgi:hypothetical protein